MLAVKFFLVVSMLALTAACAASDMPVRTPGGGMGGTVKDVLERHSRDIMSIPGVVGTAEGKCGGKPCIKVYVEKKTPELASRIPARIEGYPVEIEETGKLKAL
jgi:hypothetical protein